MASGIERPLPDAMTCRPLVSEMSGGNGRPFGDGHVEPGGTVAHATIAKALSLKCEGGWGSIQGEWTCFPCVVHSNSQLI